MGEAKTTALVTGASSGLGAEYCRQLAPRCDVIIAVARRGELLQSLADELQGQAEVHVVEADLTRTEGVAQAMERLRQKGPADYLVNNAGLAVQPSEAPLREQAGSAAQPRAHGPARLGT